ncbi:MAG TPA: hypothetical protein VL727_20575, partial [Puia sp.]|nr:hypothetical protein [Puia sp.]
MKQFPKPGILIFVLLLLAGHVFAQAGTDTTTTTRSDTAATTQLQQVSTKLDALIERINNTASAQKQQVGVISFSDTALVHLYTRDKKKTGRTILIERISLLLKDGYAVEVQMFSGGRKFTNSSAPVTISTRRFA